MGGRLFIGCFPGHEIRLPPIRRRIDSAGEWPLQTSICHDAFKSLRWAGGLGWWVLGRRRVAGAGAWRSGGAGHVGIIYVGRGLVYGAGVDVLSSVGDAVGGA